MERLGGWKFFCVFWDGERESYGFFVRGNSGIGDGRMGCFRVVRVYRALFFLVHISLFPVSVHHFLLSEIDKMTYKACRPYQRQSPVVEAHPP